MDIRIRVHGDLVRAAFQRAPEVMRAHISPALERGVYELRDEAARNAAGHDLYGTNKQAIHVQEVGDLAFEVATGTNYARALEEGTGPAAGKARYFPDWTHLIDYVKTRSTRAGEALKRAGSRARFFQEREFENRAFQLARFISHHGTQPVRFMARAAEAKESRLYQLVRQGSAAGIQEVFG